MAPRTRRKASTVADETVLAKVVAALVETVEEALAAPAVEPEAETAAPRSTRRTTAASAATSTTTTTTTTTATSETSPTKLVPVAKGWFVEVPVSLKDRRAAFEAATATTTTVNERQSAPPMTPARKAAVATKRVNSELAKLDPKNTKVGRNANAAFPQTRGVAAKRGFFEAAQQSGGGGGSGSLVHVSTPGLKEAQRVRRVTGALAKKDVLEAALFGQMRQQKMASEEKEKNVTKEFKAQALSTASTSSSSRVKSSIASIETSHSMEPVPALDLPPVENVVAVASPKTGSRRRASTRVEPAVQEVESTTSQPKEDAAPAISLSNETSSQPMTLPPPTPGSPTSFNFTFVKKPTIPSVSRLSTSSNAAAKACNSPLKNSRTLVIEEEQEESEYEEDDSKAAAPLPPRESPRRSTPNTATTVVAPQPVTTVPTTSKTPLKQVKQYDMKALLNHTPQFHFSATAATPPAAEPVAGGKRRRGAVATVSSVEAPTAAPDTPGQTQGGLRKRMRVSEPDVEERDVEEWSEASSAVDVKERVKFVRRGQNEKNYVPVGKDEQEEEEEDDGVLDDLIVEEEDVAGSWIFQGFKKVGRAIGILG
ncbi:hypothetical protein BCR33DRAFT_716242 [Rhizoclosmatium globosum]|uniref:Uncharacterized protein n=1 Tax=Rhizoclosmatium globosum TaxID=329046 RepID=A0A1Y2CET5_9FUNG|nr:hypothetical protein BCR33DRAFT_716242 [Rhizoclosmatium globosum]|eukprot:ORY45571.1 hypothetical protein BCR33DRAFT_716242 [Rhizoclosmatium globosum]